MPGTESLQSTSALLAAPFHMVSRSFCSLQLQQEGTLNHTLPSPAIPPEASMASSSGQNACPRHLPAAADLWKGEKLSFLPFGFLLAALNNMPT